MPLIAQMPRRTAAVLHAVSAPDSVEAAFAELYPAVWAALQEQGAGALLGEVVAVYHSISATELVLSAGMEVDLAFEPSDPLVRLTLGGVEAAKADHFGPYRFADFRQTQALLEQRVARRGRTPSGLVVERYLTLPTAEPDQAKWHTELWLPLLPLLPPDLSE